MSEEKYGLRRECAFRICENRRKPDVVSQSKKFTKGRQGIGRACPLCASQERNRVGNRRKNGV